MNKIDVMIACGRNSERYVDFLIKSIEKTSSGKFDFNFLLGVNDEDVDPAKLESIDTKFKKKIYDCKNSYTNSRGHGSTLDVLTGHLESEIGMVVDCDIAFLSKGWDAKFANLLSEKIVVVGCEYDGHKYMNFPNVVASMFKTQVIKDCKVSWMPAPEEKFKVHLDDNFLVLIIQFLDR